MKIRTTDKLSCNIIADILVAHGVELVIASPGSRNVPLLVASSRREELTVKMVVDERSAAFIALGASLESGRAVALCCTSGTALLNYAPAVAEAFYRGVPLIVISADRPVEWIDQDDSQTIRQPGSLSAFVKSQTDIPADLSHRPVFRMACREINDALSIALSPHRGPVHINVRIDTPLNGETMFETGSTPVITSSTLYPSVSQQVVEQAAAMISLSPRVMIVAGFMAPDPSLNHALEIISRLPGVVVLTETVSNLHSRRFIPAIDLTLKQLSSDIDKSLYAPQLVITLGGALVSRKLKEYLRKLDRVTHWHIGLTPHFVDCFMNLSRSVNTSPEIFFNSVAHIIDQYDAVDSNFHSLWYSAYKDGIASIKRRLATLPWTEMKAFEILLDMLPVDSEIHFSNGTPVRYSQLMGYRHFARVECNRGVSGIDGCTSTALGASVVTKSNVILISGDMSFQYDLAALTSTLISPRLKIVVINNSGGGIFRFIGSTSQLPERERFFSDCMNLPLRAIARTYGLRFLEASDETGLRRVIPEFVDEMNRPALLAVNTPAQESALTLRRFFEER